MLELTDSASITPPRFRRVGSMLNKLMHWGMRLAKLHHYDEFRLERIGATAVLVTPSVFNPKLLLTGEFFAGQLDSRLISAEDSVLDIGTGSGVCAIFAARHARDVVAVDINAAAVRCARSNAIINQLDHKIDVRHGDLFAPVAGRRFNWVLFNPPFLSGTPRNDRDRAWRASDVAERFAADLPRHLTTCGSALLLLSTFGDPELFLAPLRARGFAISLHAERKLLAETIAIFRLRPAPLRDNQR